MYYYVFFALWPLLNVELHFPPAAMTHGYRITLCVPDFSITAINCRKFYYLFTFVLHDM